MFHWQIIPRIGGISTVLSVLGYFYFESINFTSSSISQFPCEVLASRWGLEFLRDETSQYPGKLKVPHDFVVIRRARFQPTQGAFRPFSLRPL
jgi:hypothetical protein